MKYGKCEMCHKYLANGWYLFDENAEVTLCIKCVVELKRQGESVEKIDA